MTLTTPAWATDLEDIGTIENGVLTLNDSVQHLNNPVVIPANIHTVEGGKGSVLTFPGLDGGWYVGTQVNAPSSLTLRNFEIIGDHNGRPLGLNDPVDYGISIRMVDRLRIDNVTVRNIPGMGIHTVGCRNIHINRCEVYDVGRDGITSYGRAQSELVNGEWVDNGDPENRTIERLVVSHCTVEGTGDDGIACWLSTAGHYCHHQMHENVVIVNNFVKGAKGEHVHNKGRGVALGGVNKALIQGNTFTCMPINGIYCGLDSAAKHWHHKPARGCDNVTIKDNFVIDTGKYQGEGYAKEQAGIHLQDIDGYIVKDNVIQGVYVNREQALNTGESITKLRIDHGWFEPNRVSNVLLREGE